MVCDVLDCFYGCFVNYWVIVKEVFVEIWDGLIFFD